MTSRNGQIKRGIRGGMAIFILLLMVYLSGCGGVPVWLRDDPAVVLRGFFQALDAHDVETACEFLTEGTKRELEAKAQRMAETGNGEVRTGCSLLRPGHVISSTREYRKFEVMSTTATDAVVEIVMQDERRIPISMHREGDRWAIELPLQSRDER